MLVTDPPPAETSLPSSDVEAARYALLRRLAPSMRHQLVVNLQPIGMVYEVMERRLRVPQPDLSQIQESAHKINGFARAALNACLDVVGWLAPDSEVLVTPQEGVRECASLMATSLSFRGYALRNQVDTAAGRVRRSSLRCLMTGALMYVTDHQGAPADIEITAEAAADGCRVVMALRPTEGDAGFAAEPPYRALQWEDLQALAADEDVALGRQDKRLMLQFPWVA